MILLWCCKDGSITLYKKLKKKSRTFCLVNKRKRFSAGYYADEDEVIRRKKKSKNTTLPLITHKSL